MLTMGLFIHVFCVFFGLVRAATWLLMLPVPVLAMADLSECLFFNFGHTETSINFATS